MEGGGEPGAEAVESGYGGPEGEACFDLLFMPSLRWYKGLN